MLWVAVLSTCHVEPDALGGSLVHLSHGTWCFEWQSCPLVTWSLMLWGAVLSTCHMESGALSGSLVHLSHGVWCFGWHLVIVSISDLL